MHRPQVTVIKPKRGPFPINARRILISAQDIERLVVVYENRIKARPAADRAMQALMTCSDVFNVEPEILRSDQAATATIRQQSLAFARCISEFIEPKTQWTKIARAFNCAHNNAIYAHKVYGASLTAEMERIFGDD